MRHLRTKTCLTVIIAFMAIMAVTISGCTKVQEKESEVIKIGAILPLTGDAATYGENCKKGMQVASEQFKIPVIYEDSAVNAKKAVSAFNKLTNIDKVRIVAGDMFSSTTLAFAPIAQDNDVLVISPTSGAEDVPKTGDFIFSLYPSGIVEGSYMAKRYAEMKTGVKLNIGIIHTQEQVYTDIAKGFQDTIGTMENVSIVFVESIPPAKKDFKDIISKYMRQKEVTTVYLSADKITVSNIIKQAKQFKWAVQFLSQSTLYDKSLLDNYGKYLNKIIFTGPYFDINDKDELTKSFVSSYRSKYASDPDVWAAYGYDTILTISKTLDSCQKCNNKALADTLRKLNSMGVTGAIKFNYFGGAIRSFKLFTVSGNKFEVIE